MTKSEVHAFVKTHRLGVPGTIGPGGNPQSSLVGIAITERLEILFDTVRSSRKYANLIARPACSFVIGGWGLGEQTAQYEGDAEELRPPDLEPYREMYFGTCPDGRARMAWPGITWFVVRPRWIRYSDFDRNPPIILEFTFA